MTLELLGILEIQANNEMNLFIQRGLSLRVKTKIKKRKRLDLKVGMFLQGNIKLKKVSYLQLLFTNFKDKTKSIQEL